MHHLRAVCRAATCAATPLCQTGFGAASSSRAAHSSRLEAALFNTVVAESAAEPAPETAPRLVPTRVRRGAVQVTQSARPSAAGREIHTSSARHKDFRVDELFVNNKAWRDGVLAKDPEFFSRQAVKQSPRYLWIGCADSRVPAETICGLPPGSLFVMRNIANNVSNLDMSAMSVLQYAVSVLKVQHIVICGHYNCGGVAAAMKNQDHQSPLENWLRNIRDVYRMHRAELDAIRDLEVRARRLVEINVVEQAINLYKTQVVQKRRVETYKQVDELGFVQPKIHPCVYEPGTGILTRLDVEMQDYLRELSGIYNLYSVAEGEDDDVQWEGMGPSVVLP